VTNGREEIHGSYVSTRIGTAAGICLLMNLAQVMLCSSAAAQYSEAWNDGTAFSPAQTPRVAGAVRGLLFAVNGRRKPAGDPRKSMPAWPIY